MFGYSGFLFSFFIYFVYLFTRLLAIIRHTHQGFSHTMAASITVKETGHTSMALKEPTTARRLSDLQITPLVIFFLEDVVQATLP